MIVLAVAAAALAAFVISFMYYAVMPARPAERDARPRAWQIALEFVRSALVAGLVCGILLAAGWSGPGAGALLGLALWAIPLVLLSGSALWEGVPVAVAALHAGDWLIKLPAIGLIVGLFV